MTNDILISIALFLSLFFSISLTVAVIMQTAFFTKAGKFKIEALSMFLPAFFWSVFYYLINK